MSDNPSGQRGLLGVVVDWFDRFPVAGPMAAIVAAIGIALATCAGPNSGDCSKTPLAHVYKPSRLQVVQKCAKVTGTVIAWRHEHDGDYHVSMVMDDKGWTNPVNARKQHGYTVVEFIPLMPRIDLRAGQRLELVGTKVLDNQHGGWVEMHPVFSVHEVKPGTGPNDRHLAPPTEEK